MASLGVDHPAQLTPHLLRKRISATELPYAELYDWLAPGQLISEAAPAWAADWAAVDPDSFRALVR
ncbi:hypothetical protein [Nocardia brasiliensis]|uniref:hypothetical protein n=1 Tax=Nocardia brasiliensis TaxID=37326 RepID=UPI002455E334|nr:hypothetical protein [Nocardia brasiliensis]